MKYEVKKVIRRLAKMQFYDTDGNVCAETARGRRA
jgi:hypothetical protein